MNIVFGIIVLIMTAFSYFIENMLGSDIILAAARFSAAIGICSILTGVLAGRSLRVKTAEEHPKRARVMRTIGLILGVAMLLIACFGVAIGISTGTVSYIYVLMIPVMLFYCACVRKPKPKGGDMQAPGLQLEHDPAAEVTIDDENIHITDMSDF